MFYQHRAQELATSNVIQVLKQHLIPVSPSYDARIFIRSASSMYRLFPTIACQSQPSGRRPTDHGVHTLESKALFCLPARAWSFSL
ncbi:uncharacterized protein PHALS_13764 [Plasmopara halstedii]|uniref:Uncharacterized protein n=1 Tax=Plasmopara halstedii TaxID=4781 RepID=A0A0P1AQR1_PLAHL|nr:uncharacterized protein PHALS_13764 [Plasmopara halstedii]CEG43572.1 hypothetical protein PHALS_13764 [Plasmopara halstedii]|eukprot:XP_024579941.1 hypothetical protein PHALS_13764 [Plasmopara halstedii]